MRLLRWMARCLLLGTSVAFAINVVPRMDAVWPDYDKKMRVRTPPRPAVPSNTHSSAARLAAVALCVNEKFFFIP